MVTLTSNTLHVVVFSVFVEGDVSERFVCSFTKRLTNLNNCWINTHKYLLFKCLNIWQPGGFEHS